MTSCATLIRRRARATRAAADTPDMTRPAGGGREARTRTIPAARTLARKARRRGGAALCSAGTIRPALGDPGAAQAATSPRSAMAPRRGPGLAQQARRAAAPAPVPVPIRPACSRRAMPGAPVTART